MAGVNNGGRARGYEALRQSEELHRATLSSVSDAVFLTDDDGGFKYICPNVDVIFGYVPDEVSEMSNIARLLGENLFDAVSLAAKGEISNVEREVTTKSGNRKILLINLKRVSIAGGTVLCTCRDVTDLRDAERHLAAIQQDLVQASNLMLAGQLAASVAHEVQQPLTAILLNASTCLRLMNAQPTPLGELRKILDEIEEQSLAGAKIIERLKTLVRQPSAELLELNVNEAIEEVLRLLQSEAMRRRITLHADLAKSLSPVLADRMALQQAILNLAVNAMDAVGQNEKPERIVTFRTRPEAGRVIVEVADPGRGIPAEDRAKLFQAFFTTKAQGLGLGLAVVRAIAEQHGGEVSLKEEGTPGTTFVLSLPALPVSDAH